MLYAIDTNIATFVEMPLPAEHYNAYNAPFLYITQHKQARRVAIMSLSAFARFAQEVDSIITTASSPTNAYIFFADRHTQGSADDDLEHGPIRHHTALANVTCRRTECVFRGTGCVRVSL
jgi:hypothetical protein